MITTLTHRANTISACIIHLCRAAATSRSLSGKVDQIVVSSWRRTHIYKRHARGKYIIASTSSFSPIPKHLFLRGYRDYITCRETFHTEKRDLLLHTLLVVHHRHCTQFCIYVYIHTRGIDRCAHTHTRVLLLYRREISRGQRRPRLLSRAESSSAIANSDERERPCPLSFGNAAERARGK